MNVFFPIQYKGVFVESRKEIDDLDSLKGY